MLAEVDQSGRTDQTNKVTVLALANSLKYSVQISGSEKRKLLTTLRYLKPHWSKAYISVVIFSTLLFLLLKNHLPEMSVVVIDTEFPGYEPVIKERLLNLFLREGKSVQKEQIIFRQIGKKSPAHKLAWRVFNKMIRPSKAFSSGDVLAEIVRK